MTGQEMREKAIKEMDEIADRLYKKHFEETGENGIASREIHEAFYDAGFRKEEEVRKETVKERERRDELSSGAIRVGKSGFLLTRDRKGDKI